MTTIYLDMSEIISAHERAGGYFFSAGALRFFSSRIGQVTYCGPGGIFFTTSEQFRPSQGPAAARCYTVRRFDPAAPRDIRTVGQFNGLSRGAAVRVAKKAAAGLLSSADLGEV